MTFPPTILVRCDGSPQIGLGHVVRCLALADELRERCHVEVCFAMREGDVGMNMVRAQEYPVFGPTDGPFDYSQWVSACLERSHATALILDNRDDMPQSLVADIRNSGILVATIDDLSERRLESDLAFYPPIPQVKSLTWNGFTGELFSGWEWVLLRRQFANRPPLKAHVPPVVLVVMGGSDPSGLTLKAVKALDLLDEEFETIVVLGSAFCHEQAFEQLVEKATRRFQIRRNVGDMAGVMAEADLAVASFSVTAYELATTGVPGIYLCLTEDHAESATTFVAAGIGIVLGVFSQVSEQLLAEQVRQLVRDSGRRAEMACRSRQLADGRGAERIARILTGRLETKYVRN